MSKKNDTKKATKKDKLTVGKDKLGTVKAGTIPIIVTKPPITR